MPALNPKSILLVSTKELTVVLIVTSIVFAIFIGIAIFKMFKLKAENKRLLQNSAFKRDKETPYKDFTESHLYDNNN